MPTAFELWEAKQKASSAPRAELTAFEKWELEQERLKKEKASAAKATLTGTASGSAGVSDALQPAQDDDTLFGRKPLGVLGALSGLAGGAERTVDAFGAIDPGATARSALGATQQALGTAIRAPAEQVSQALGPMQLLMEAAAGKPWAIKKLQEAETQADVLRAGLEAKSPASSIAAVGKGIAESGSRLVEEQAPRMLKQPESLLTPEGIAWAVQTGAQSLGPMAIGALSSRFGGKAGVAPFVPAGAAEEYARVREEGGLPSDALGRALPRGGLEVAFESPVLKAAGAGRAGRAMLFDTLGETATEGGNIGLDVASGRAPTQEEARSRLAGAALVGPVTGAVQTALSAPIAALQQARLPPAAKGAALAREKLQKAGAYADGSKPPPVVPIEGRATTPPGTAQKAPVAPPVQPKAPSKRAESVAADRLAADMLADPTLGVPAVDRVKTLQERLRAYTAIEQAKLEQEALAKKLPAIVKKVEKAANAQTENPFDVTAPTNRLIGNITKGIPATTPVDQLVRTAQAQTRRTVPAPVAQEAPVAPVQAVETPVKVPRGTPLQEAGRVIDERRAALEQASTQNRLDEGTVKKLQREEEELRLTLQEDERRKAAGVLQTPEVPYLSPREITSISEKRSELREQLEKHRASVGYGNQLNELDVSLSKLGDNDNDVIALATKLQTPTKPQTFVPSPEPAIKNRLTPKPAPLSPTAPVVDQVPNVQSLPLREASITNIEAPKALEAVEPIRVAQPEQQSQEAFASIQEAPVATQEAPATLPTTPVAPAAVEAPVASPTQPDGARQRALNASSLADRYLGNAADDVRAQALLDFTGQPYHNIKAEQLIGEDLEGWNNFLADAYLTKVEQVRPLMDAREQKQSLKDTASFMERSDAEEDRLTAALPNKEIAPKIQTVASLAPAANDLMAVPTTARTAQPVPAKTGDSGRDVVTRVALGGVQGSETQRLTAAAVKNSPNLTNTKVVVVQPGPEPNTIALPDGTVVKGTASYSTDKDTMYIREDAGSEEILHEANHATTTKAISDVKQGRDTTPEHVEALSDLEASLAAIKKIDTAGLEPAIADRIKYAGNNVFELTAILQSAPGVARALDKMRATVTTTRTEKGAQYVPPVRGKIRTVLDNVVDALYRLINKPVKERGTYKEVTREVIRERLLTDAVAGATQTFQKVDTRKVSFKDIEPGYRAIKGEKPNSTEPARDAMDVSQETPLSKGKGIKARLTNLIPTPIKKAALARGTASQETADMVGSMRGMGNLINHTLASDLQALSEVGAKELGKRLFEAEGTQNALVKYFSGDTTASLPQGVKKAVDKIRAGVDALSFKLAALGVLPPEKLAALVMNLGKYTHRSYKAWDMKPGEWADLARSSQGIQAKTVAEEMFAKVKDEMLDWIAIPDDATLDALYAKATDKDNKEGAQAAITKLNTMLFNHVPAIDRQDTTSAATIKEQIAGLKAARDKYANDPDKAVENAERLMQKLLDPRSVDLNDDRTSNYYKLFAVDAGATKKRQDVPNWLQTVWGKNEEFDAVAIATVHAVTDMVAKHSKINEWKERLIAAGVVRTPEQGGAFGYSKLDSGNRLMDYGSLEGHYIKDEDRPIIEVLGAKGAADAAALFFGGETANAFWRAVEDVAATTKIMGVTLNFSSMVVNAVSSIGVISGALVQPIQTAKNIGKSVGLARREALNVVPLVPWLNSPLKAQDAEFAADLKQAFEADYLGDVAIAQDLRSELKQQVLDEAYKGAPKIKRGTEAVKRIFRDVKDTGSRFSAFGDSTGKMLNWYNRIPALQQAHPELTPEQVKALALEHAKASMPSYTRSAPLARLISRRAVLLGAFATFNSEMYRTAYNDVARGIEYLRKGAAEDSPAAAWYGTQQLMMAGMKMGFVGGVWKVAGLSVSAMGALVAGMGDDDDEEKKDEVQQYKDANDAFSDKEKRDALTLVVPDYMRGDVFPIRKVDDDNWTVGTLARFDPMGLNNALVAAQKGADAFTVGYTMIEGLIGPSIVGEDIVKVVSAVGTDADRVKEAAGSIARSVLIPGTVRQFARNFSDTMRNMDEGQARDLLLAAFPLPKNETALTGFEKSLGWMGLTATPVNIPEEVVRKLSRLGAEVNKQQRKATETLNDTVESDQEFWTQAAIIDATAAETFKKARAIVEAANTLGYDNNYIVDAADKYSAPLEEDMLYGAIEGKLYLPDLYKTLDGWYDRKVKLVEKDPAKLKQLNERYNRLEKEITARNKARIATAKQEGIEAI